MPWDKGNPQKFTKTTEATESCSLWSDKIYKGKSFQFLASNSFVNITLIIPYSRSEEAVSTHRQLRPGERLLAGEGGRGRARPRRRVTSWMSHN